MVSLARRCPSGAELTPKPILAGADLVRMRLPVRACQQVRRPKKRVRLLRDSQALRMAGSLYAPLQLPAVRKLHERTEYHIRLMLQLLCHP